MFRFVCVTDGRRQGNSASDCSNCYVTSFLIDLLCNKCFNWSVLLGNKCSDWSVTGHQRQQSSKPSDWSVCYVTSVSIGLFYRCRSVTTKQQALWLVCLFYNKYSDWSVTGSDQRRQSNKSSDWSICYVTSFLIGLLQVLINDNKSTSPLIGLSVI